MRDTRVTSLANRTLWHQGFRGLPKWHFHVTCGVRVTVFSHSSFHSFATL
jgi:hypothetical protein